MITPQLITALNKRHPKPEIAAAKLQAAADRWGIHTRRQVAMFLGQLCHESGLVPVEENLNYSARRITQVWPGRFPTLDTAQQVAYSPPALANRVYGGRGGNILPGDGWLFRGRGMLQLTFRSNYLLYGERIGFPLVAQPDLLLQYGISAQVGGAFWALHSLNGPAERGDVAAVTRAINGGYTGLDDRERLYQRALARQTARLGLLDAEPDLYADQAADADARHEAYLNVLNLLVA